MSLPVHAKVQAAPNFLICLNGARAFMVEQDAASAAARFKQLQAELVKGRSLLSFAPESGRPARFLDAQTAWGKFQSQQALQLARAERSVLLLSLRHGRQSGYRLDS